MQTFGEVLRRERKKRKLSQKHLGEALAVSQQTVANWENDKATPEPERLAKVCEFFGLEGRTGWVDETAAARAPAYWRERKVQDMGLLFDPDGPVRQIETQPTYAESQPHASAARMPSASPASSDWGVVHSLQVALQAHNATKRTMIGTLLVQLASDPRDDEVASLLAELLEQPAQQTLHRKIG